MSELEEDTNKWLPFSRGHFVSSRLLNCAKSAIALQAITECRSQNVQIDRQMIQKQNKIPSKKDNGEITQILPI